MVLVKVKQYEWHMDGFLISNLEEAKKAVKKDWDMIFTIDGMEGAGKSVLGIQCCKYLDENFDIDSIAFDPANFIKKVIAAKPFSAVLYDEAFAGLSGRATLSSINKAIVQVLSEIRQKNLFVVIIQPSFFELDRYVALWRSRALLHVYTKENLQRGQFAFFSYEKKKTLWLLGKKLYSYAKPPADFLASFNSYYPIDEKKYREVKFEALKAREKEKEDVAYEMRFTVKQQISYYNLITYLREQEGWSLEKIGKIGGMERQAISFFLEKAKLLSMQTRKINDTTPKVKKDTKVSRSVYEDDLLINSPEAT